MSKSLIFDRRLAIEAGLLISIQPNLSTVELAELDPKTDDPEYIEWAKSFVAVVHVPNTEYRVVDQLHGVGSDTVDITANQWGSVYQPMIEWLSANNIPFNYV